MSPLEQLPIHAKVSQLVREQQKVYVSRFEDLDGTSFKIEPWEEAGKGAGISCIIENGNVFERGAVNISMVDGVLNDELARQMRDSHTSLAHVGKLSHISAVGLSVIFHPRHPMAPTIHANCRFITIFSASNDNQDETPTPCAAWFGGGIDLTPHYIIRDDIERFHTQLKQTCDIHDRTFYPRFKPWCDKYFWNKHRHETRGVGGIFFDNLGESCGTDSMHLHPFFAFVEDLMRSFPDLYLPIVQRWKDTPSTAEQREWQLLRRGRYVEFNLLHDRGTKFGLAGGSPRVESILASLPPQASWRYDFHPDVGSREEELLAVLRQPQKWVQ